MNDIKFPTNPENGMIFEAIPGIFYKYNAGSNCWARLKGVESLGLATPLSDGLMSKQDFDKLQNLVIPPPQTTLKGEECNTTFKSGTVALYSFDESLQVSKNPQILNQASNIESSTPWSLHENTAGFDFRVPINRLLQEIQNRNQFKKVQLQGDKGPKGLRGEAGRDRLDTGPVGLTGDDGTNSPFDGSLVNEGIPFESLNNNRAIVDISTEEVSEDENYLVATRANIGNPDACPAMVTPKDFNSALVVALNTLEGGKLVKGETVLADDCALICRICSSNIHHINMQNLLNMVFDHFVRRVNRLKLDKETLVKSWLGTMVTLFNEQKAALCCALENCRSRGRNQRTRQYIESQRIQAALGDFQLLIDGEEDRQVTDMDGHKDCPVPSETTPSVVEDGDCTLINLDSKIHISDPRANSTQAVTTFLPKGTYVAEITSCCANFNASFNNPRYSGRAAILYTAVTTLEDEADTGTDDNVQEAIEKSVISFPDFGPFENESAAKNAYQGLTLSFEHAGGDVSFWLLDADNFTTNNDGIVTITIKNADTLTSPTAEEAVGFLYVYRDEISFNGLLGRITPFSGSISASENFGSIDNEVDLTHGPALLKDQAQIFFYDGSDGLSLFFVAGEQAGPDNDQQANLLIDVEASNNTSALNEKASDAETNVRRLSASQFQIISTIDGDSAGFAIGEFDPSAEYSVRVDPKDLNTMRTFVAVSADSENILISQGGSEGIGGDISVTQNNSAPIYQVDNIPSEFGANNTSALRVNNENSGQNVTLTRPISLNIPATVGDVQLILQDLPTGAQFAFLNPDGTITPTPPNQSPIGLEPLAGVAPSFADINAGEDPLALPPNIEIRTFGFTDQDFADVGWQATARTQGDGGSSDTERQTEGGNPGPFRETTHSSVTEERAFVAAGRPTAAFFGPGSTGALKWNQFFASDQFGNTWIAIRETSEDVSRARTGARPLDNGANAIYLRDATMADIEGQTNREDQLSANVLGGLSGLEPGSLPSSWTNEPVPSYNSTITTYHVQQEAIYSPRSNGAINSLSFTADAQLIPAISGARIPTVPPPSPPPPPAPLSQEEVDALLAERENVVQRIEEIDAEIQVLANTPMANNAIGQLQVEKQDLQVRLFEIDQALAENADAQAAITSPSIGVSTPTIEAPTVTGSYVIGAVISQNGSIFRGPGIRVSRTATSWINRSQSKLTSTSFSIVNSDGTLGNTNPDFSITGDPINLGYFVESNHDQGGDIRVIGIDNWNIDVGAEFELPTDPDNTVPPEIIDGKGALVGEAASRLPRGAPGSPQDPCIVDVCTSIKTTSPQSLRYILTDLDGNKYFSSFRSINVEQLDKFQFFSFGPPISMIAPPEEFTAEIISSKNLDLSLVSDQLSSEQLKKAESLDGIARLTFIQELLGPPTDVIPNGRRITDIEIEFRNMPFSSVDFGFVSVKVGIPGSIVEIVIDNFELDTEIVGQTVAEPEEITSSIKRVVATQSGTDDSTNGLIYSGFDSYFGDYTSLDGSPNFHGNNFLLLNQAGQQKLAHVNARTGFQDVVASNGSIIHTVSGDVTGPDALVVDDFGVVYIADAPGGRVDAFLSANASITNTAYGDISGGTDTASVGVPGNTVFPLNNTPLPITNEAVIAIGRYKTISSSLANDIIVNFSGNYYKLDSIQRVLFENGPAARDDTTTPRCCFGAGNPPGPARTVASGASTGNVVQLGSGSAGISFTTDAPANPQPTLPVPTNSIGQTVIDAVQAQLDDEFNQFDFYTLDSGSVYKVTPSSGNRTLVQELGENAFSLRAHPRTGDLYYVVDNRGSTPISGTIIRRLDINDLDDMGRPKIKTVFTLDGNEGIFGITFGNSVPSDPSLDNPVLYALLSTLENPDDGRGVDVRIVEIAEQVIPPVPSQPISEEIPLNSIWNTYVSGGKPLGNPTRVIFSRLVPGGGCQMHYKQVQWYERGWRIGACCGALVEVGGAYYIVVKRSIGTDISCGGGESLNTACIRQFIDIGEGHPAIAWPTISPEIELGEPGGGGEEFLGLPTSGFVNFVKDEALSDEIINVIRSGNALRTIGRPSSEIPFILFPAA